MPPLLFPNAVGMQAALIPLVQQLCRSLKVDIVVAADNLAAAFAAISSAAEVRVLACVAELRAWKPHLSPWLCRRWVLVVDRLVDACWTRS